MPDDPTFYIPMQDGEPGLMRALEAVVAQYDAREGVNPRESVNLDPAAIARCVAWLNAKFGAA